MTAVALTIAGSDSSGGAGAEDGERCEGLEVRVSGVANLDPGFVAAQIDAPIKSPRRE